MSNAFTLADDYLIEANIAGTAAAAAWIELRLLVSEDGANFGTWESGIFLGIVNLSATPQLAVFSVVNALGSLLSPMSFKVAVMNNTGAAFGAAGNTLYQQSVKR